jgi:hypothetical protein
LQAGDHHAEGGCQDEGPPRPFGGGVDASSPGVIHLRSGGSRVASSAPYDRVEAGDDHQLHGRSHAGGGPQESLKGVDQGTGLLDACLDDDFGRFLQDHHVLAQHRVEALGPDRGRKVAAIGVAVAYWSHGQARKIGDRREGQVRPAPLGEQLAARHPGSARHCEWIGPADVACPWALVA